MPSNLDAAAYDTAAEVQAIPANGCLRSLPFDGSQPECATGNKSSATTIALIGDSTCSHGKPAFQRRAGLLNVTGGCC